MAKTLQQHASDTTTQSQAEALLAEITMLSDLLDEERKARSQVEEELVEALKVCSSERAGRLDAETKLEMFEINSKLPSSSIGLSASASDKLGGDVSPFSTGDESSIFSPGVNDTWNAVGSPDEGGAKPVAGESTNKLNDDFDAEGNDKSRQKSNIIDELQRLRKHSLHLAQVNDALRKENLDLGTSKDFRTVEGSFERGALTL